VPLDFLSKKLYKNHSYIRSAAGGMDGRSLFDPLDERPFRTVSGRNNQREGLLEPFSVCQLFPCSGGRPIWDCRIQVFPFYSALGILAMGVDLTREVP
jgi:hypothetical protein